MFASTKLQSKKNMHVHNSRSGSWDTSSKIFDPDLPSNCRSDCEKFVKICYMEHNKSLNFILKYFNTKAFKKWWSGSRSEILYKLWVRPVRPKFYESGRLRNDEWKHTILLSDPDPQSLRGSQKKSTKIQLLINSKKLRKCRGNVLSLTRRTSSLVWRAMNVLSCLDSTRRNRKGFRAELEFFRYLTHVDK